uniref:Replication-associated protein n=1 Tax=Genomoviridae sp. TaxID=2202565 RepID=A0A858NF46_9VIRU|nr:MAG: replication-associated protein [Genomoviridae sp.]
MQYQFRYALLTYAQCDDLDPFKVVNRCAELGAECIVGRETHADGGIHLHAFVDFGKKFRSRDTRVFDVEGRHPNVSPSKGRPGEGWDYATKDGDIVAGGLGRPDGTTVPRAGIDWDRAMSETTMDGFLQSCLDMDPQASLRMFTNLQSYCRWRYRPEKTPYTHPGGVQFDPARVERLSDWVSGNLGVHPVGERRKSLILWGPSRLGKTLWARSLGEHAYFGGLFSMDESLEGVEYAVFDDFGGLKYLPTFKFWLGHQKQFYVTDKYKGKKLVEWGKPSIWLSNSNPLDEFGVKPEDVEWLQANCDVIQLEESLLMPIESGLDVDVQ